MTNPPILGYAVMRLRNWEFEVTPQEQRLSIGGIPVEVKPDIKLEKGTLGFIQVFDTLANAEEAAGFYEGGAAVVPITGGI